MNSAMTSDTSPIDDPSSEFFEVREVSTNVYGRECDEDFNLKRRGFIGLSLAAGAALMTTIPSANAAFYSTKPVAGVSDEWVKRKGLDVLRYANYIKSLNLKNITPKMVLAPHFKNRGKIYNSLPPKAMWSRISLSLRVIDRLAWELKKPVKELLSIYRSPQYNYACRGRSLSQHKENRAIDFKLHGASAYTVARKLKDLRNRGYFTGGVGTYSSFVHIDTRGHNASWVG